MKHVRHGPHITTEDRELTVPRRNAGKGHRERMLQEEEHIKQRKAAMRKKLRSHEEYNHGGLVAPGQADSDRTDVLTQKPLNFHAEERTRRKETDQWLDRHFGGSEWSLSQRSSDPSNHNRMAHARSRFYRHHQVNDNSNIDTSEACEDFNAKVRRAQSFNCIPISHNNNAGNVSRVIKQTTTTYRPGMEGKVVFSSITKNVVSPPDPKIRAYHSTSNLNTRNTQPISLDNQKYGHSTSLLNGIVKGHSPKVGKKDTSVVREIPIMTLNRSYANILDEGQGQTQQQPNRPPRRTKGTINDDAQNNTFMKSTGDLYDNNTFKGQQNDVNYYENRRSYYFGTSADNLASTDEKQYSTTNHASLNNSHHVRGQTYFPMHEKRKSRRDQLIMESAKSYDRVQSAPDQARPYHHTSNMHDLARGGESTTTGFESTAGLLGVTYQGQQRQVPLKEQVYHDSPKPERKAKRLVPTVEGRKVSKKEHDRVVYRSESTKKATK